MNNIKVKAGFILSGIFYLLFYIIIGQIICLVISNTIVDTIVFAASASLGMWMLIRSIIFVNKLPKEDLNKDFVEYVEKM